MICSLGGYSVAPKATQRESKKPEPSPKRTPWGWSGVRGGASPILHPAHLTLSHSHAPKSPGPSTPLPRPPSPGPAHIAI